MIKYHISDSANIGWNSYDILYATGINVVSQEKQLRFVHMNKWINQANVIVSWWRTEPPLYSYETPSQ